MLRNAAGKVMWVGRATVFLVGLSVILALVLGVATTALAGNLDPLKIGSLRNVATQTTQLVGKVATGSAFVVKNPSGGSALDLQVNAGQAPMSVNAEAGTATNLSADELDGKSSDELVRSDQGFVRNAISGVTFTNRTSATVNAPADGFVIVNGTVMANTSGDACNPCYAHARISNTTTNESSTDQVVSIGNGSSFSSGVVPMSWVFPVDAGANTFELRTGVFPSGSPIGFDNPTLTALYVPYGANGASALASSSKLASPTGEQWEETPGGTMIKK